MNAFPIKVESLFEFLPHRPPMVWVDQVNWVEGQRGEAQVVIRDTALYWQAGRVIASAPLEWISQAYGYCRAAQSLGASSPKKAFLAGIRDAELLSLKNLRPGTVVSITVETVKELGPILLVRGTVEANGTVIAKATLKLYAE